MSVTISRSRMNPGSGVISATTIASTASGTASSLSVLRDAAANRFVFLGGASAGAEVISSTGEPAVHELVDVSQNLRYRAIQLRRNLLSHFGRLVERLRQRRILHDRHLILDGLLFDAQRH